MAGTDVGVAVIGAGIGGLTFALALRERGITAEVFEHAPALTEVGAAVALAANGSRILTRLGLGEQLAVAATVPDRLAFRHWSDGRLLVALPVGQSYANRFGGQFWGLHRARLQEVLRDAWGPAGLHLGRGLRAITGGPGAATLELEDGTAVRAEVVVGADGLASTARRWVSGDEPYYTGTSGFRGLAPIEALRGLPTPGDIQFWVGPGAHLLHYPVGDRVNFLAVLDGPPTWDSTHGTAEAAPGELVAGFAGWHPAVLEMLRSVPQSVRWALHRLAPVRRWFRDRVVLLGDAAHAMLPHHGQGANQTIEDAAVLARCLAEAGPAGHRDAFVRYQRLRRAHTRQVQRVSSLASGLLHLPDGPAARARDAELAHFAERFSWIHGHAVDGSAAS
ncbi:FAD-dependent monooxygenase [Pseudonocardia spinosispora]|uniref:FAD-dependent monooxygenase n=1 Tax=Pseudonocardia spinosispora TaxID=103441 RepID=UPI00048E5642|nr:FAD-dependent monooxygenase [Pseudonocardia spinosispora]